MTGAGREGGRNGYCLVSKGRSGERVKDVVVASIFMRVSYFSDSMTIGRVTFHNEV